MNAEEITKHLRELFQPDVIELENTPEEMVCTFKKDQYTVFLSGKEEDFFVSVYKGTKHLPSRGDTYENCIVHIKKHLE